MNIILCVLDHTQTNIADNFVSGTQIEFILLTQISLSKEQ